MRKRTNKIGPATSKMMPNVRVLGIAIMAMVNANPTSNNNASMGSKLIDMIVPI